MHGCYFTRRERPAVQAELANAIAEQAELDRAFDAALEALSNPAEAIGAAAVPSPPPLLFALYATRRSLFFDRATIGNKQALAIETPSSRR